MKGMRRNDTYLNGDGAVEARGADNSEDTGSNPVLRISHYPVHSRVLTKSLVAQRKRAVKHRLLPFDLKRSDLRMVIAL